jgi:hypothetical protein
MRDEWQSNEVPAIEPSQIWLIEQSAATALLPLDRAALTGANVVIYDPVLAPLVARALPIGSYAEPLSRLARLAGSALSPRAIEFASEGWSVAQLVKAGPGRRRRLRGAAEALRPLGGRDLPVQVIAKTAVDRYHDTRVRDLPAVLDEFGDDPLTLIFGPLAVRYPAPAPVFTANGLAG